MLPKFGRAATGAGFPGLGPGGPRGLGATAGFLAVPREGGAGQRRLFGPAGLGRRGSRVAGAAAVPKEPAVRPCKLI